MFIACPETLDGSLFALITMGEIKNKKRAKWFRVRDWTISIFFQILSLAFLGKWIPFKSIWIVQSRKKEVSRAPKLRIVAGNVGMFNKNKAKNKNKKTKKWQSLANILEKNQQKTE